MQTSLQFYKIIHVVSIVLFFSLYAVAANKEKSSKADTIVTGIMLVLILVGGMGLLKYIGIAHGAAWPLWVKLKLSIWLVIGLSAHMTLKRFPQFAPKLFWIYVGLLTLASYFANYKIM